MPLQAPSLLASHLAAEQLGQLHSAVCGLSVRVTGFGFSLLASHAAAKQLGRLHGTVCGLAVRVLAWVASPCCIACCRRSLHSIFEQTPACFAAFCGES